MTIDLFSLAVGTMLGVLLGLLVPMISPWVGALWCARFGHTPPPTFRAHFGCPESNVTSLVRCAMYRCRRCNLMIDITSRAQAEALGIDPADWWKKK